MKITERLSGSVSRTSVRDERASSAAKGSFAELFENEATRNLQESLSEDLAQIDEWGGRLTERFQIGDLLRYKELIRQFLAKAAGGGYSLREERSTDRSGRVRLHRIVSEVDRALAELAEMLVSTEKNRLQLLGKVGEIRGLLVNLLY